MAFAIGAGPAVAVAPGLAPAAPPEGRDDGAAARGGRDGAGEHQVAVAVVLPTGVEHVKQRQAPAQQAVGLQEVKLVAVLDEIEAVYPGVEDRFLAREVMVKVDGNVVNCRFYPVSPNSVKGLPEIRSGDWVEHRRTR